MNYIKIILNLCKNWNFFGLKILYYFQLLLRKNVIIHPDEKLENLRQEERQVEIETIYETKGTKTETRAIYRS